MTTGLVAAACTPDRSAGPRGPAQKVPVTVYVQGPLTGRYSYLAIPAFRGARLRFKELNAQANFPGQVILKRANSSPVGYLAPLLNAVVGDTDTVAVIGPTLSGESEEAGDTYNEAGIPFITATATNPELADEHWEHWYRTVAHSDEEGPLIGERMAQMFRSIYVIHDTYDYAQNLGEAVAAAARENGADIVAVEIVDSSYDLQVSKVVSDVADSGAEALFFAGYDSVTARLVKHARRAGLDIPIWSGEGSVSEVLLDEARDAATNMVLTCPCNLQGRGDFLARYEEEYGETSVPLFAAEGYDVASLIGEGIRSAIKAGAIEPIAIREGSMEYLDGLTMDRPFRGVAKDIAFDPATHELASEDRRNLIFFYRVESGAIIPEGSAAALLAA